MIKKLSFVRTKNTGKPKRAAWWLRMGRVIRRKRVSAARLGAVHAIKHAQREIKRLTHLANVYAVPLEAIQPLPAVPLMPGQDWVEYLRAMGELNPAVKPAPITMSLTTN